GVFSGGTAMKKVFATRLKNRPQRRFAVKPGGLALAAVATKLGLGLAFALTLLLAGRLNAKAVKIGFINMKALYDESAVTTRVSKAYDREKRDIIEARESVKREIETALADLKAERLYLK